MWVPAMKKAGVRYRRPNQTRHTYASMMLSAGEHPMWVAKQMGHTDWTMIARAYRRWMPTADKTAGEKAEAAFDKKQTISVRLKQPRNIVAMADTIDKSTLAWVGGILVGAVTTTATAVHVLHDQYITPIKIFESDQKVQKLTAKIESQADIVNQLKTTKEELEKTRQKLAQIENSSLFTKNDPYPATLDIARLGEGISKVYSLYKKDDITVSNDIGSQPRLLVKVSNSVFNEIRYSYNSKTEIITSIGFTLDWQKNLGDKFLEDMLTKALGDPQTTVDRGQFRWRVPGVADAYLILNNLILMKKGLAPRLWDEDSAK